MARPCDRHDAHVKARRSILFRYAVASAKKILQPGDRLRVTKCPGTKRWMTFDHWNGVWMVSKSGIDDYAAITADRLNGDPVDFTAGFNGEAV